jgi:hypothetical protein
MTEKLKFRIYYAVYVASEDEYKHWTYKGQGFEDAIMAPTDGVQVIIQENATKPKGYDVLNQRDFYCWRPDQGWIAMDLSGRETYEREVGFPKYTIHGYNLRNDAYHEAMRRALAEGLGE